MSELSIKKIIFSMNDINAINDPTSEETHTNDTTTYLTVFEDAKLGIRIRECQFSYHICKWCFDTFKSIISFDFKFQIV
jgi:hypothetical protein